MSHQTQDTSLVAYYGEVMESIGPRHLEVMRVFAMNLDRDFTNNELAEEMNRPINTVTPRVYELRGEDKNTPVDKDNPILTQKQIRKCAVTGRNVIAWGLNPEFNRAKYRLWREIHRG
jgi:hypothetical protein